MIYQIMLHFYSFLNLSSLNLILQWPLNLMGGGNQLSDLFASLQIYK